MSVHQLFEPDPINVVAALSSDERFLRDADRLLSTRLTIERKSPAELIGMAEQIEETLGRYPDEIVKASGEVRLKLLRVAGDLAHRALDYRAGAGEKEAR